MNELITKEELLELGFEIFQDDEDGYCGEYKVKFNKKLNNKFERNIFYAINVFLQNKRKGDVTWLDDNYNEVIMLKATKTNVLKLIEIAKLRGKLE